MKKILSFLSFFVYTVIFILLLNSNVLAADNGPRGPHPKIMEQLTEEQQNGIKAKLNELWEEGASREEIRETIHKMLEDYGVDFPEEGKGHRRERGTRPGRGFMKFADQLSEEQKNAIEEKVKTLREEGSSREEIHTEVSAMLTEYGVEMPENSKNFRGKRGHRPGRGWMQFSDELSDEQRKTIHEKVKVMKDEGASKEEIHQQVETMLKEYGVEIPDDFGKHREMWSNLSEEQQKQIRGKR